MSELPPEVQALRDRTLKDLKAVLAARAKVGVPIHLLSHEYEETTFSKFKLKEMGYGTVLQFINDNPDYFITHRDPSGHIIVKGIPSKVDAHIFKLVSGQKIKSKKKKSRKIVAIPIHRKTPHFITSSTRAIGRPPQTFSTYRTRQFSRGGKQQRTTSFRNKPSAHQSIIPLQFQRNQPSFFFGTRSSAAAINPRLSSTLSSISNFQNVSNNNTKNHQGFQSNTSTPIAVSPSDLQSLARKLKELLQQRPNGVFATRLRPEYKTVFNEELPGNIGKIIVDNFLDFVKIESPVPPHEILYLKTENVPKPLPSPRMTPIAGEQTTPKPISNGMKRKSLSPRSEFKIKNLVVPQIREHIDVYVCHIESLDRFFIQLEDSRIPDLVEEMQNFYEGLNSELFEDFQISKPKVGEFCCARFTEDKLWFRAKIWSVKEQKNMVNESYRCHVFYPDYGNDEYVLSTELKCLTEEFCELPFQAIQCCLNDLYSPDGGNVWSENAIEFFKKITNNVKLDLEVIERNGTVLSVDMYDANRESVCRHLCFSGHAKKRSAFSQSTMSSVSACGDDSPKTFWRSLSLEGTDDTITGSWVEMPANTVYIEVCISYIIASNDVCMIIIGEEYHNKLEELETLLNNNFENVTREVAKNLQIGEHYLALSDESWYRVELISFVDGDCEVLLVDHGRKTVVGKDEVKNIPKKFLKLPFQAISCTLEGVPVSSDPEILQFMTDLVLGKAYIADILSRDSISNGMKKVNVELIDTTSDDDVIINSLIAERIQAEDDLQPRLPKVGEDAGYPGYIAFISSEGEFNLQIVGPGLDRLEILTTDMTGHFSQAKRAVEMISHPNVGMICCAKFPETKMWYRAQVKRVFQSERKVEVEFIDYGNREVINMALIRKPTAVSEKVTTLPFQAVKCKLDGLDKLSKDDETYLKLKGFGEAPDIIYVTVVDKTSDDIPVVQLSIPIENDNAAATYDFLEQFQKYLRVGDSIFEDMNMTGESSIKPGINDSANTTFDNTTFDNTTFDNISMAQATQIPSNNSTLSEWDVIPSGHSPNKTSVNESNNNAHVHNVNQQQEKQLSDIHEEEQKSSSGVSSSNSSGPFQSNRSVTPAIAHSEHWGIPELKLDDRFVVGVVQDADHPDKFSIIPTNMWSQLEALHKEMTQFYKDYTSQALRDISSLNVGDVCVVYHSEHEIWYRAVIHAVVDDRMVVKYPDFNAEPEMVSNKNVRLLTDQFKTLPFLSIRCRLHGIEPFYGSNWSPEACDKFYELVINGTFQVEIIADLNKLDKTRPLEVRLHNSVGGNHFVVNTYLVKLGFAKQKR